MQNMSFHVLDKICKFCGVVVAVAKTRHSRELYIWERKRVRVLSARGLVHCFFTCSQGKKSVLRQPWSSILMTHLKTSAWFLMTWKCKTHLCKSRSGEDDFSSKCRCPRAADKEFPVCVTCCGQLHMRTVTKQTNSYSSSFSISDLKLSSTVKARVEVRVLLERFSFAFTVNAKRQAAACRKSKKMILFWLISLFCTCSIAVANRQNISWKQINFTSFW